MQHDGCFLKRFICHFENLNGDYKKVAISMLNLSKAVNPSVVAPKTSAGGIVKGTTQKKAIGEMLESQMSDIHKTTKTKEKKNPVKKERDEKQEEAKKLQKDIKAFLVKNSDI